MTGHITTPCLPQSEINTKWQLFDNWLDPIEAGFRDRAREFLQAMLEAEPDEALGIRATSGGCSRRAGLLGDLTLEFDAVGTVVGHGFILGSPAPNLQSVHRLGRTLIGAHLWHLSL